MVMRARLAKLGIPILIFMTILVGCPLPFEFSGEGAGETERDPASPDVTAPVTFSYAEENGASGSVAVGGSHVAGVNTTVTLSTETPGAVIYYTTDGNGISNLNAASRIGASSGSFTITRTATNERRDITAIAVGPNMRPSPESTAVFDVSPFPILSVSVSANTITENGGNGTFTITANTAPASTLTVNLQTSNTYEAADVNIGFPGPGTPPFTRDLTAGSTTITIPIIGQPDLDQTNDPVTITVLDGVGYSVGNQNQGTITIEDDQTPVSSVTYVANTAPDASTPGGSPPTDSNPYQPGNTVTVADNGSLGFPVGAGFVFGGWNTAADGSGTTYQANNTFVMGSVDVTLYAVWTPVYTVTYDANGASIGNTPSGSAPTDANQYESGNTVTVLGNGTLGFPAHIGFVFDGWNTAADGSGTTYNPLDADATNDSFAMGSSNVTLYAVWTPTYLVAYHSNSPTPSVAATLPIYRQGDQVTVSHPAPSRAGFAFGGWNTAADGSGTTYKDPADPTSPDTFIMGSSNVTLYAVWLPVPPAPSLNLAAVDVVTFGAQMRVNPHPTFELQSSSLTGADGLVFRLAIGAAPSTGVTKAADEIEVPVVSGNTASAQFPQGQLAPDSSLAVYAIQRGTNTAWSNAVVLGFVTDGHSWANRATPTTFTEFSMALVNNSVDYIDMRELGPTTFTLNATVQISSAVQKRIVGDSLTFDGTNGLNSVRIFNVASGAFVTLDGLTFKNGVAQGEDGNNAAGGGGGGGAAGLGGAIFIGDGAQVEISNVTFNDNKARGGDGGNAGGGASPGANGAGPYGGSGGALFQNGGSGGEFSGGGGGGGYDGFDPFPPVPGGLGGPRAGNGGSGGYGGGGGGGGSVNGGATAAAGSGGGSLAYGGPGATASFTQAGGGGGGAALGGAIFLDINAVLRIHSGVVFAGNSADGGNGGTSAVGPGGDGQGIGGAIFGRFGSFVIIMDPTNPPFYSLNLADLGVDLYGEPSAP